MRSCSTRLASNLEHPIQLRERLDRQGAHLLSGLGVDLDVVGNYRVSSLESRSQDWLPAGA